MKGAFGVEEKAGGAKKQREFFFSGRATSGRRVVSFRRHFFSTSTWRNKKKLNNKKSSSADVPCRGCHGPLPCDDDRPPQAPCSALASGNAPQPRDAGARRAARAEGRGAVVADRGAAATRGPCREPDAPVLRRLSRQGPDAGGDHARGRVDDEEPRAERLRRCVWRERKRERGLCFFSFFDIFSLTLGFSCSLKPKLFSPSSPPPNFPQRSPRTPSTRTSSSWSTRRAWLPRWGLISPERCSRP